MALNPAVLHPRKRKLQVTEMATSMSLIPKVEKSVSETSLEVVFLWGSSSFIAVFL